MNIPPEVAGGVKWTPVGGWVRRSGSLKWERFSICQSASDWTMPFGGLWSRRERQRFNLNESSTAPGGVTSPAAIRSSLAAWPKRLLELIFLFRN